MFIYIRRRLVRPITLLVIATFFAGGVTAAGQGFPPPSGMPITPRPPSPAPDFNNNNNNNNANEKLISLNFRDAPLDQVLTFYAELTGRTLIKAPGINATITLRGQTRLTQAEALQAIESVLAMNNVGLVPMGDKFLKVVQPAAVRQEGLPLARELPEEGFPETDQLVSQIVQLRYIEIQEAQALVQGFLHSYGKIQPLERTNSLLITDTKSNLQRILEILEYVDQPTEAKVETRVYELKYAEAAKIASRLNELIQDAQAGTDRPRVATTPSAPAIPTPPGVIRGRGQPAAPEQQSLSDIEAALAERGIVQGKVKIVADERTNILIVISRPSNFAFFDKIVAILDRPVEAEILVRVVALEYAKAEEISSILNEFIGAARAEARQTGAAAGATGAQAPGAGTTGAEARSQALEDYVSRRAAEATRDLSAGERGRIGQLSSSTRILADKRTNSLLLMGTRNDVAALEDVIDRLDTMLAQVLIEAVILEITLSDNMSYGVDWLQQSMTAYSDRAAGPGGALVRQPLFSYGGGWAGGGDTQFREAGGIRRDNTTLPGGALSYYLTLFDLNMDAIIRMAASSSDARVLSTPVVLTTDNTEAKIVSGEERPIVTATSTTDGGVQTSRYEYRNIGINLTVTPRVNPQRFVTMDIVQTADNVGDLVQIDGNPVPIITKREMQASVAVESRSTIVLGGLVSTGRRRGRTKVPLLGDIPIIGTLFRADTKQYNRTELLVLITPYVLMTPEEARKETERLQKASRAPSSQWYRGWSDSPLAKPTRQQRREEKRRKQMEESGTVGQTVRGYSEKTDPPPEAPSKISLVVPSQLDGGLDSTQEVHEAVTVIETDEIDVGEDEWVVEPAPDQEPESGDQSAVEEPGEDINAIVPR